MEEVKEQSEIEKAKELIEKEREQRAAAFKKELDELCQKYQCRIEYGPMLINAV